MFTMHVPCLQHARYSRSRASFTFHQQGAVATAVLMERWIVLVLLATAVVSTCSANGDNVSCISATFPVVLLDGLVVNSTLIE